MGVPVMTNLIDLRNFWEVSGHPPAVLVTELPVATVCGLTLILDTFVTSPVLFLYYFLSPVGYGGAP